EKAGILNKTKVSENGKKVRKNWTQTWTVLHGGVLTFHKDPKSNAPGASSKTNQIVPEFTVDLKGATICWATKDKSSKKNVLELKTRNGVEFLIQYDTESIIVDWHRVLTDTIRQLTERHAFEQLGGGHGPKKGSDQADEVPDETPHAAVCQGERIHPGQRVWLPFGHAVCTREDNGATFCGEMYQSGGKKRYFPLDTDKMKTLVMWMPHFFVFVCVCVCVCVRVRFGHRRALQSERKPRCHSEATLQG
ncbi:unnamed protein product, partial [Tetraodon nigroviridis]